MSQDVLSIACRNRLPDIGRAAQLIETFGAANGLPSDVVFKINLALDEVLTNIISYAYEDEGDHEIDIRLTLDQDVVTVKVEDDGRAYDPIETPTPDLAAGIDERPIGGLGVHIVRSMMDGLEYRRKDGRNVLIMRKRISGGAGSGEAKGRSE